MGVAAGIIGGSLIGGLFSSNSASEAANAQTQAAGTASAAQLEMFYRSRADQMPWLKAGRGEAGLQGLTAMINAGPGEYTQSPGYEARLAEGNKQILRNASATGSIASGRTMKALTRFGQDYATNDYDRWLQRWYNSLTPYQSLAGVGQTTAQSLGNQANQVGTNLANNAINAGNARASGYINQANAITGSINSGLNALGTYYGNQPTYNPGWTGQQINQYSAQNGYLDPSLEWI